MDITLYEIVYFVMAVGTILAIIFLCIFVGAVFGKAHTKKILPPSIFKMDSTDVPTTVKVEVGASLPPEVDRQLAVLEQMDTGKWIRLAKAIRLVWGTPEGEDYVDSLILNKQVDDRQGFPPPVLEIITELALHHPKFKTRNVWDDTLFR